MIYEEEQINIRLMNNLTEEFINTYITFHQKNLLSYNKFKDDKGSLNILKKKFPYFSKKYCFIHKLFDYPEFSKFNNEEFKKYLYEKIGKKIRGIFKHGQCAKTEISCEKIIMDMKKDYITIAITKNTLLANKQWTTRCIQLMKKHGLENLKNQIIVISSEFNDLNGNATHCKNKDQAWCKICENNNNYKVIFMCANKTRFDDACELLNKFYQPTFNIDMRKKIIIQYDEGHNDMSGIPIYRNYVENMLIYDFVEEFIPITASKNPIDDCTNPLWLKNNIDKNKLNYINDELTNSRIKSNALNYSSIQDATHIIIDDIYNYNEYDNTISPEIFKVHYPNKDYHKLGFVNACPVVLCGDEKIALNYAKKILDNQEIECVIEKKGEDLEIITEMIFNKDISNFHIIITPCRTIITEMLMRYAAYKNYYPVTIGLYNSSINYLYKDYNDNKFIKNKHGGGITNISDNSKEFNDILYSWLKKRNLLNRPVIIFGNYQSLGESNTFVNSDYGYLRSAILLPGCNLNEEKHYQFLLRCCFLLNKFSGITKHCVEKFIISHKKGIDDALQYESLNDDIVQDLIDNSEINVSTFEFNNTLQSVLPDNNNSNSNNIIYSIPVQFKIEDYNCEYVKKIISIMEKETGTRTENDKSIFMSKLISSINESSIIKYDKNVNYIINLNEFKLTEFRCFKEGYTPENYRFKNYYDRFKLEESYNNGKLKNNECGLYSCLHKHKGTEGHINSPNTFYILFAYQNKRTDNTDN
jgi:hypothetical protein